MPAAARVVLPFRIVPMRSSLALVPLAFLAALVPACGSSSTPEAVAPSSVVAASGPKLECPAPIGNIPREDCTEVADDFGALTFNDALKLAGSGHDAEAR